MENQSGEKRLFTFEPDVFFRIQPLQKFSLSCWKNRPGEFVSHHRLKTRCVWSKMQRDIRAGNWLNWGKLDLRALLCFREGHLAVRHETSLAA